MQKLTVFFLFLMSIFIILFLSGISAYAFFLLGKPFLPSFIFSFVVIWLFGLVSNKMATEKAKVAISKIDLQAASVMSQQSVLVNCEYCRAQNEHILNLNGDNAFECVSCKQPNKVIFSYGVVRSTTPLNTEINITDTLSKLESTPNDMLPQEDVKTDE